MSVNKMESKCRIDGRPLRLLKDLGPLCVSDFIVTIDEERSFPLRLGISPSSGLVQLMESLDPELMFRQYWYVSGVNESMVWALGDVVRNLYRFVRLDKGDTIIDIGTNDGTLLKMPCLSKCWKIAFEPAKNFHHRLKGICNHLIPEFFNLESSKYIKEESVKAVTSIAMFYDVGDPSQFVRDVRRILARDGIWIVQMSYLPLMIEQNAFDNIVHEHVGFYSQVVMEKLLKNNGMVLVDLELNNVNGGSIRFYIARDDHTLGIPGYECELFNWRISANCAYELDKHLESIWTYEAFFDRVDDQMEALRIFLEECKAGGKKVLGYGSSTKANTLLQYAGITSEFLPAIADRNPDKWGKITPGSRISVIDEDSMREQNPDFLIALPWHFINGFLKREEELMRQGMKFVVPLPEFRIYEAKS